MKLLPLGMLLLLTAGCAQVQHYTPPAGAPQAQIRSEMDALSNYRNYLTLTEAPIVGCKYGRTVAVKPGRQLFAVRDKTSRPAGSISVEAAKPLYLVVDGAANAGRTCRIEFVSEFAPGARYVIKGGIIENPETYDSCQVKIFDEDTGAPLRMVEPPASKGNGCALDRLPLTVR